MSLLNFVIIHLENTNTLCDLKSLKNLKKSRKNIYFYNFSKVFFLIQKVEKNVA